MNVPSANPFAWPWLALLAVAMAAAGAADPSAGAGPRFVPVEVFLDSPRPVAAWQFELADRAGTMRVAGIEGGGHPAFPRAPYYDRQAVAGGAADRIVVADYSLAPEDALPRGRVRLATLHVLLAGEPDFAPRLVTATTSAGKPIEASITVGHPSPAHPREGDTP